MHTREKCTGRNIFATNVRKCFPRNLILKDTYKRFIMKTFTHASYVNMNLIRKTICWHTWEKNHTDEMFYCDKCEFTSRKAFQLKTHIKVKHEGIKHFCEQCDYSAPYTGGLKRHIKRVHEGLSYSCEYCDQKSTTRANLKLHTDAKHLGIKYPCDKCEFKCSQPGSLKIHKQSKHWVIRQGRKNTALEEFEFHWLFSVF